MKLRHLIFGAMLATLAPPLLASETAHAGVLVSWSPDPDANPYSPEWTPRPRPGWQWVPGRYDPWGNYLPGYWQPAEPVTASAWVPGYWVGPHYYDGYWRPIAQPHQVWLDGYYAGHTYVAPRWVAEDRADRERAARQDQLERSQRRSH